MKHICLLLLACLSLNAFSQTPQGISYQGVLRNLDGSIISGANITITFRIHDNTPDGLVVYEENHSTTTSSNGLVNLTVGMGTAVTGVFSQIAWGAGNKHLQVLMDNGSGEIDLGTQQMMSVPYALYAGDINVNISSTGDTLVLGNSTIVVPGISASNNSSPQYSVSSLFRQGSGVFDVDGNFYPSIILYNGQEWMQKNLEVTKYRNGDGVNTDLGDFEAWYTTDSGAYLSAAQYNLPFGNYYNQFAVSDFRGICPVGWNVPSMSDWDFLESSLGGPDFAGSLLKSTEMWADTSYAFFNLSGFNSNLSGFSALPGALSAPGLLGEGQLGLSAWFWTRNIPYIQFLNYSTNAVVDAQGGQGYLFSIRCIKD